MQALLSGRAGVAILLDGERLHSIGLDPIEPPTPRTSRDVRFLLGDVRDVEVLDEVDLATVRERLRDARAGDDALQLALLVLDAHVSLPTRESLAGVLDGLLGREVVRRFVEGVLFASPVPPSADLAGARRLVAQAPAVALLLEELDGAGAAIAEVGRAWEMLPRSLFLCEDDRAARRVKLVRAGVFRQLVGVRRSGQDPGLAVAQVMRLPVAIEHRAIVDAWIAQLRAWVPGPGPDAAMFNARPQLEVDPFAELSDPAPDGAKLAPAPAAWWTQRAKQLPARPPRLKAIAA